MKIIIGHVGDELDSVAAFALCGGSALYLLTYSAIRIRIERRWQVSRGRFVAAVLLLAPAPARDDGPGDRRAGARHRRVAGLHAYELVRWREARAESRSVLTSWRDRCRQQVMFSSLLGPDRLPDVSTALSTTVVGPTSRQYAIVLVPPRTPSGTRTPFR